MSHTLVWCSALASNLLTLQGLLLPQGAAAPLHILPILQGAILIGSLTMFLFGILITLVPLRRVPALGTTSLWKVATAGLFCLSLAVLGAIGAGIQGLIAALAGTGALTLLLAGVASTVIVGVLGLAGQRVMRLSPLRLLLLGALLMLIGLLTALVQVALLLLPSLT
jgi:hypothetical protein